MENKLIIIGTSRCGACKQLMSYLKSEYEDDMDSVKYHIYGEGEVDEDIQLAIDVMRDLGIMVVPFSIVISGGDIVSTIKGFNRVEIDKAMSKSQSEDDSFFEFNMN